MDTALIAIGWLFIMKLHFTVSSLISFSMFLRYFRRRKGLSALIPVQKAPRRNYSISNPEDFRQASAIPLLSIVLN